MNFLTRNTLNEFFFCKFGKSSCVGWHEFLLWVETDYSYLKFVQRDVGLTPYVAWILSQMLQLNGRIKSKATI